MSDMTSTLGNIVAQAVGPLPHVCQEQVLLDLERARMSAEDFARGNAVIDSTGNAQLTWRCVTRNLLRQIDELGNTIENVVNIVRSVNDGSEDAVDAEGTIFVLRGLLSEYMSEDEDPDDDMPPMIA